MNTNSNTSSISTLAKKLLIIGLGDIARRMLPLLSDDWCVFATQRQPIKVNGVVTLGLNFDALDSLDERGAHAALINLPRDVDVLLYTVPPSKEGVKDARLSEVLAYWKSCGGAPKHIVYISTTGVYGDCKGAWVNENAILNPQSDRAVRRVDAEQQWIEFARNSGATLTILRVPGIYALERMPIERVRRALPILKESEDSFSNHIHADDLAAICAMALVKAQGVSVYNASDDSPLRMGEWFTCLANAVGLPAPPQMSRVEIERNLSPLQWSFMRESRRLSNEKIKRELGIVLHYPSALDFVATHRHEIKVENKITKTD